MKQIFLLLLLFTLLACNKDEPQTLNLEEQKKQKISNSIEGKWQYVEFWSKKNPEHLYFANCDPKDDIGITEFKKDNTYNSTSSSGKVWINSNFKITDVEEKALTFKDWDFYFYTIMNSPPSDIYTVLINVKEIFIEEVTKDYLTIRCDKITQDGAVGPIYAKLRRVKE